MSEHVYPVTPQQLWDAAVEWRKAQAASDALDDKIRTLMVELHKARNKAQAAFEAFNSIATQAVKP